MTHTYKVRLKGGRVIEVSAPTMPAVRDGVLEVTAAGRVVASFDGAEIVPGTTRLDGGRRLSTEERAAAVAGGPDRVTFANDHELEVAMDPNAPRIFINDYNTAEIQAWRYLAKRNDPGDWRGFLFTFGGAVGVIAPHPESGRLRILPLDINRLREYLDHRIQWVAMTSKGDRNQTSAPQTLASHINVMPDKPVPHLERLVTVPIMTPKGKIHQTEGYDKDSRTFYVPDANLSVPEIPRSPDRSHIERARGLIGELLFDFKFVTASDRAHAIACLIQPFVRSLIDGATPLYAFDAPTPGSGKGLLSKALIYPAVGHNYASLQEQPDEAEWRKQLFTTLKDGPEVVRIDNVNHKMDSGALSMCLTEDHLTGRIMRTSIDVEARIRCLWMVTGNNLSYSPEMLDRAVRIRQDTGLEDPRNRQQKEFRHYPLMAWAEKHRGDLIAAALTLARAWYARRNKPWVLNVQSVGSFESWAEVMGGILKVAGIEGFLANRAEFRASARGEVDNYLRFAFKLWNQVHGEEPMLVRVLSPDVEKALVRAFEVADDADVTKTIGRNLRQHRDAVFGPYKLVAVEANRDGIMQWAVLRERPALKLVEAR